MNPVAIVAIYFVVWWIVLFTVLPWGVRTQRESDDIVLGTSHSAPAHVNLVRKAIATSIVAAVLVFLIWLSVDVLGYDLEWVADTFDLAS